MSSRFEQIRERREIPPTMRPFLALAVLIEISLKVAAARDIHRRQPERIRGPKAAWYAALGVNLIGPLAYFGFGRL
jgi:hypothetical protein